MRNELGTYLGGSLLDPLFDFFAPEEEHDSRYAAGLEMKTDIKSDEKNYVMEVDLPGVDKKDISVNLKEGYLTIRAKVDHSIDEKEKGKKAFVHRERFSGVASRSYYVGDIDEKTIDASFANGVLTLSFPKVATKQVEAQHLISIK